MTTGPAPHHAALIGALTQGAPITDDDLLGLATSTDILSLAMAADEVRRAMHGRQATYVRVADVTVPDIEAGVSVAAVAREIRVSGPASDLLAGGPALERLAASLPSVPLSAGSLDEFEVFSRASGRALIDIGRELHDRGVAAVAFAHLDRLIDPVAAAEAIAAAGLAIPRATVSATLDAAGRLAVLRRLQLVQRAIGSVRSFGPLARAWNPAAPTTGYEDVRHLALARLLVRDVPSVQVDWSLYGPKLAQVALTMGADDLDGVTASDEAPDGRRRAPLEEVRRNITAAGFTPVERDGLHLRLGV